MATVQIRRDPFARGSVVRKANTDRPEHRGSCDWCGSRPARFIYGWEDDGKSYASWDDRAFCSVSCRNSFWS